MKLFLENNLLVVDLGFSLLFNYLKNFNIAISKNVKAEHLKEGCQKLILAVF